MTTAPRQDLAGVLALITEADGLISDGEYEKAYNKLCEVNRRVDNVAIECHRNIPDKPTLDNLILIPVVYGEHTTPVMATVMQVHSLRANGLVEDGFIHGQVIAKYTADVDHIDRILQS